MDGKDGIGTSEVEVLEYPACPGALPAEWSGWVETVDNGAAGQAHGCGQGPKARGDSSGDAGNENDSAQRSFELGRARGREEGRQAEREAIDAARGAEAERQKRQLDALVTKFSEAGELYLREVEREVVKLALAVASRILRREAQMDPLLLTGAVRVALGQLAASSDVRLLVPAAELELWQESIAHLPHLSVKPVVAVGEGMRLGDCAIESHAGTVDLGVRAQLAEIERGFFDRAQATETSDADHDPGEGRS
ncbi:MAG TPA: FliH/SctL family protein [Terracidiphilus sp.]|jgi:flagellar assembly protein FliH